MQTNDDFERLENNNPEKLSKTPVFFALLCKDKPLINGTCPKNQLLDN